MATSMTQAEFNAMLQIAIAQGLPGGVYTSKFGTGEEIDAALDGGAQAAVTAVKNRSVTLAASGLQEYLDSLPRLVTENLTISVTGSLNTGVNLQGFYGPGSIVINGNSNFTLYGSLQISRCNLYIAVQNVTFDGSKQSGTYSQTITSYSRTVAFRNCNFLGGPGNALAINSDGAARIIVVSPEIKNVYIAVSAQSGSIISVTGTAVASGNKTGADAYAGIVLLGPTIPQTLGGAANTNRSGLIVGANGTLL